ncbi:hypothetical protein E2C01_072990 [Portunus trituberculatus]|uniref:Uncharacterized protein n=1 Tax=Portunus trituberculatus TaxID=210409 RepID=A0A5B7I870_PORTR|nr:hypothetical protein [Portunus trituberculatus]
MKRLCFVIPKSLSVCWQPNSVATRSKRSLVTHAGPSLSNSPPPAWVQEMLNRWRVYTISLASDGLLFQEASGVFHRRVYGTAKSKVSKTHGQLRISSTLTGEK